MSSFLAQVDVAEAVLPVPEVAWSAFAPELALTVTALVLLLVAVARDHKQLVMAPVGILAVAAGAWLITRDFTVPGAVSIVLGVAAPALVFAFPRRGSMIQAWGASLALVGALVLTGWQYASVLDAELGVVVSTEALAGALANDGVAFFTRVTVYLSALLAVPLGYAYLNERGINRAEVEPLLLLSVVGMAAFGAANDLIGLFIALEVLSLALYVLCGLARRDRRSQEASLKYFVMGSVASAILLYGMALIYLATGSVDLPTIGATLGLVTTPRTVAVLGIALVTVGIGFKVSLVPFHWWTPDVYQGAPTNITAFMAAATKAAAFAAILRLYLVAFPQFADLWVPVVSVIAAVTMLYGAYLALLQRDLKRILAYSSITHAGYAAIGVVSNSDAGLSATLWYLFTYAIATIGAFGCVIAMERLRRGEVALADIRGLGRSHPLLAGILGLCLLSLAGIPVTAGFVGKLLVFEAGVAAGLLWLVLIGVLSTVVAGFFYLRIAAVMFLEEVPVGQRSPIVTSGLSAAVSVSAALVLFLGIQPEFFLRLAESAAALAR